jgi:hypothetical protein
VRGLYGEAKRKKAASDGVGLREQIAMKGSETGSNIKSAIPNANQSFDAVGSREARWSFIRGCARSSSQWRPSFN